MSMNLWNCCCCPVGVPVDQWFNVTMVRPENDSGGAHYTSAPFARYDTTSDECPSVNLGHCGLWLVGGDLNGLPSQNFGDNTNDIQACATPDSSHVTSDHNCYQTKTVTAGSFVVDTYYKIVSVGTTNFTLIGASANTVGIIFKATGVGTGTGTALQQVNMASTRFGGQWLLAQKQWHGTYGFFDKADPWKVTTINFDAGASVDSHAGFLAPTMVFQNTPPQVRYRTKSIPDATGAETLFYVSAYTYHASAFASTSTTGQYTGINATTGSNSSDYDPGGEGEVGDAGKQAFDFLNADTFSLFSAIGYFCTWASSLTGHPNTYYVDAGGGTYQLWQGDETGIGGSPDYMMEQVTIDIGGSFTRDRYTYITAGVFIGSTLIWHETLTMSNTSASYVTHYTRTTNPLDTLDNLGTATCSLSDAYSAEDCYDDFLSLLDSWSMSNFNLAALRGDEALALAPLIVYDEVSANFPTLDVVAKMDDYTKAQNIDGSWQQRDWIDPNDYVWTNTSGGYGSMDAAGGNHFNSPMRTSGTIISHNQQGSDRHWWPNFNEVRRTYDSFHDRYQWYAFKHGDYSDTRIPAVALRWQNGDEAQYDSSAYRAEDGDAHEGNYPMAFLNQNGRQITGGKFVQAAIQWPRLNKGRPCGPDKYSVDQSSVGCITDAGAGYFMVTQPSSTTAFPAGGYIIVTGSIGTPGVYPVTSVTGSGPWTVNVGTIIDQNPTGWSHTTAGNYLGWLRFSNYPGICGREAVTPSYDATTGTVMLVSSNPLVYLRVDPATGGISVDVFNSAMTSLTTSLALRRPKLYVASTAYTSNQCVIDSGGNLQLCTTAGTSGGSAPSWSVTLDGTTSDGTAVWTLIKMAVTDDQIFIATHAALATAAFITGAGVDYTKFDTDIVSDRTGVHFEWQFNYRAMNADYISPPTFYAGLGGCTGITATQFNYPAFGSCIPMIGIVPGGMSGVENFGVQTLFNFPSSIQFDDYAGAHWQAAVMLTMPDPLWQTPFTPDCAGTINWIEDDGSGHENDTVDTPNTLYYAHHPLVEALNSLPTGYTLPAGLSLLYDTGINTVAPPSYPGGIPTQSDYEGVSPYVNLATDWGFAGAACNDIAVSGPFHLVYETFVTC